MVMAIKREELQYKNHSARFLLNEEDLGDGCFSRQFCKVYNARLAALKNRVVENAQLVLAKYLNGDSLERKNLEDLVVNEMVFVVGTLEKRTSSRTGILKELADDEKQMEEADENGETAAPSLIPQEFIELEDDTQIIKLSGAIELDGVATGCVVGLYGKQVKDNLFEVIELVWPLPAPTTPLPTEAPNATIAFLSGLNLSGDTNLDAQTLQSLSLFTRWLGGMGTGEKARRQAARVSRVIIAGGSLQPTQQTEMAAAINSLVNEETEVNYKSIHTFDQALRDIASLVWVDVMSGQGDCCPQMLPHQPIPRQVLPLSAAADGLCLQPNPYDCTLGGYDIIVSSGESVDDMRSLCSRGASTFSQMSLQLCCQHLSPTCPDTVDGFPFSDRDPLVMERSTPHIFVCGNQLQSQCDRSRRDSLLVTVSKFSETHTVTFIDLENLKVHHEFFGC